MIRLRPGRGPVAVLLHRGHGPPHLDVILGAGAACPALRLALHPSDLPHSPAALWRQLDGRARACAAASDHRRRWLTAGGPVSRGRGHARLLLRASGRWIPHALGLRICLPELDLDVVRGFAVVSVHRRMTLP